MINIAPGTTKNRILRADDSIGAAGGSATKRGTAKDSVSKFFLMDCFMNSRSKSNMNNNDSSLNAGKGNSLEVKLPHSKPGGGNHSLVGGTIQPVHTLGKHSRKSRSPKESSSQMIGNRSA